MTPLTRFISTFRSLLSHLAAALSLLTLCSAFAATTLWAESPGNRNLQQQIAKYSAIAAKAEPPTMISVDAGRIWTYLGTLYEDAGQYTQSEMAYLHALRLLEKAPISAADQARAMDDLGTLYMMRGDTQQAERAELHALQIRKQQELTADLPPNWYHLAALSLREHRARRAQEYAQLAVDALTAEPHADPDDAINAQFVLAVAHLRQNHYPDAIAMMEKTMDLVRSVHRPDDFATGFGSFLLGYIYWKAGDIAKADSLLKTGSAAVERQLGSDHPVTVMVLSRYEGYLRHTKQVEAARIIGRQIKQARPAFGSTQGSETLAVTSLF